MPSDDAVTIVLQAGAIPIWPAEKKVILGKLLNEIGVEILHIKQKLMEINNTLNELGNE